MQARGERVGLKARLTLQGDDAAVRQTAIVAEQHELLGHDADRIVGHHHHTEEFQDQTGGDGEQNHAGQTGNDQLPMI